MERQGTRKRMTKNGEKEYAYNYIVSGLRKPYKLLANYTSEELTEVRNLREMGVTKKKLCEKYKCSYPTLKKILDKNKATGEYTYVSDR